MASMHMTMLGESHEANEINKGFQIEKEAQSLSGSSRQGGSPNQV
jgi:hypothetical protein